MAKKKDFSVGGALPKPIAKNGHGAIPQLTEVDIPLENGHIQCIDFSGHCGHGFDDTIYAIVHVIERMKKAKQPRPATLHSCVTTGLRNFWRFSEERAQNGTRLLQGGIDGFT